MTSNNQVFTSRFITPYFALKSRQIVQLLEPVNLRIQPHKYSEIYLKLNSNLRVHIFDEKIVESQPWININGLGWVIATDHHGNLIYSPTLEEDAHKIWELEYDKRKRLATAICGLFIRSFSLTKARAISASMLKFSLTDIAENKSLLDVPDIPLEHLLVEINNTTTPSQMKIYKFIKILSCQQSNPILSIKELCNDISDMLKMRPTSWVGNNLAILQTNDQKSRNDDFVNAAARGDKILFEDFISSGQELISIHSDLKYTALHAAAGKDSQL